MYRIDIFFTGQVALITELPVSAGVKFVVAVAGTSLGAIICAGPDSISFAAAQAISSLG